MKESTLTPKVMLAVTKAGGRVWRNNIGTWQYAPGKYIRYGVCHPGGSDLIGFTSTGRFLGIEIKPPGRDRTKKKIKLAQERFRNVVNAFGGLAFVATSVEDVVTKLTNL